MLDPNEQKKGGFGAFVARERERVDGQHGGTAADATGTSDTVPAPAADAPEPRRRRLFRSIL